MFQPCWAQSVRHNAVDGFRLSRLRNGQRIIIWDRSQRRTDAGSDPNNAEAGGELIHGESLHLPVTGIP